MPPEVEEWSPSKSALLLGAGRPFSHQTGQLYYPKKRGRFVSCDARFKRANLVALARLRRKIASLQMPALALFNRNFRGANMENGDGRNSLWGEGPAWPRVPEPKSRLELQMDARATPEGRRYELRLFRAELLLLFMGLLSLGFGSVWCLLLSVTGLIVIGAMTAVDKFSWAQTEIFASIATTALLIGSAYGLRELGFTSAQTISMLTFTPQKLAETWLLGMIVWRGFLALFATAGIADELTELKIGLERRR